MNNTAANTVSDQQVESLLEVNNIEVIYNHVILVLKGVSLSVPKGGITALLGGNGAGKTTTLKARHRFAKPGTACKKRRNPGDGRASLF